MRPFLIFPFFAVCGTLFAAPAIADIRDTQFRVEGDTARIWISFDNQPVEVLLTPTSDGVRLDVRGVEAQPHNIQPSDRRLVSALQVIPVDEGAQINITASGYWSDARAELRQGGVLLHVRLDFGANESRATNSDTANRNALAQLTGEPVEFSSDPNRHDTPAANRVEREHSPEPAVERHAAAVATAAAQEHIANAEVAGNETTAAAMEVAEAIPEPVAARAEPCLAEAALVDEDPWDDARLISHAACLRDAGEIEDAAGIYQQMLAFEPENFDIAMELATIRRAQGNDAAARTLFDQAASNATSDAEAVRAHSRIREIQNQ